LKAVFDTNVLVSTLIGSPNSTPKRALSLFLRESGVPLLSEETFQELCEILDLDKIKRFVSNPDISSLLQELSYVAQWVETSESISVCRDSKDNKFLEVAVNGGADYLVTGDKDLLVLNPFRGIPIVTPTVFLQILSQ
jgi:putative PIN family toxin of toxin-antitoxin system